MATEYGVTSTGFVRKRLDAILSDMTSRFEDKAGVKIDKASTSVLYMLFGIIGYELSDMWSQMQNTYNAMYPDTASGANLTNVAAIAAIKPISAEKTTLYATCYSAKDGTVIPISSQIQDSNQYTYSSTAAGTITATACSDIIFGLSSVTSGTIYSLSIDGTTQTYTATSTDTPTTVLTSLHSRFSFTDREFTLNNGVLKLTMTDQSKTMNVQVSNISITSIGSPIEFSCDTYGAIDPEIGSITTIITSVANWASVNNAVACDEGRSDETDTALRQRWASSVYNNRSSAMVESIQSAVYNNCDGVTSAKVFENATAAADTDGRPPHSIEVVVLGGESADICAQIWKKKPAGIATYGSVSEIVNDSQGINHTINFNRPTEVPIWLNAVITKNTEETWSNDSLTEIAAYLLAAGRALTMGDDVILQKFLAPIYTNLTGISNVTITATSGTTAGTYAASNISISARQIAVFDASRIGVTLSE